jgi:hypothetical protein
MPKTLQTKEKLHFEDIVQKVKTPKVLPLRHLTARLIGKEPAGIKIF